MMFTDDSPPRPLTRRDLGLTDDDLATLAGPIHWRHPGRLTDDRCETCGIILFDHERVEDFGLFKVREDDGGMGLGGISAYYCQSHAPIRSAA